jgi:conjugal transfer/entry exclusion protein
MKTQRITGDAGMFFAVAVPSESYRAHVGRIEKALSMLGYVAVEERAKLRSDGGDPIVALRVHFEENVGRLGQQIDQAERELRSLQTQLRAFTAGLQALSGPEIEAIITPEH